MRGFRLGLTGSIGMGKSTTAGFFAAAGVAVWDADATVHRLYGAGGGAVGPVAQRWPGVAKGGVVDREALKTILAAEPGALSELEAIVHPLVAADRVRFLNDARGDLVVLDIPLLFETGAETQMDATLLVTAPAALQRARVLSRPGMTEAQFERLIARQMPDRDKRARATHIIETLSLASAEAAVHALIAYLKDPPHA